jgi:excinuclease ABC subunit A
MSLPNETVVEILAPAFKIYGEDEEYLLKQIWVHGYCDIRIDVKSHDLGENIELDESRDYHFEVVMDRFVVGQGIDKQVLASDGQEAYIKKVKVE